MFGIVYQSIFILIIALFSSAKAATPSKTL